MQPLKTVSKITDMVQLASKWSFSSRIALVPTMGYLHEGHLSLVHAARREADEVVVSIFVNPLQFGPNEDLDKYPRDLNRDLDLLSAAGATLVFVPKAEDLTPVSMTTVVDPGEMGAKLCGKYRPGHFTGVCTIVSKLFNVIRPGIAVFGWKDAQQFLILKKMVHDLAIPVNLRAIETAREPNGLALSSRNTYLNDAQRKAAPKIAESLMALKSLYEAQPEIAPAELRDKFNQMIRQKTELKVQYIEIVSTDDLEAVDRIVPGNTLIATAVFAGETRLIDNIRL